MKKMLVLVLVVMAAVFGVMAYTEASSAYTVEQGKFEFYGQVDTYFHKGALPVYGFFYQLKYGVSENLDLGLNLYEERMYENKETYQPTITAKMNLVPEKFAAKLDFAIPTNTEEGRVWMATLTGIMTEKMSDAFTFHANLGFRLEGAQKIEHAGFTWSEKNTPSIRYNFAGNYNLGKVDVGFEYYGAIATGEDDATISGTTFEVQNAHNSSWVGGFIGVALMDNLYLDNEVAYNLLDNNEGKWSMAVTFTF